MRKKALDVILEINKNNFELGSTANKGSLDRINSNIIIELCKEMCELQKIECLNNAESHFTYSGFVYSNDDSGYKDVESYIKKDSILNCKNVCEL
jgi:hypothetical protein